MLRNPRIGRNLELDIFFPEISCSVEAQGAQHGLPVLGLQKDHADFMAQQARDMIKAEACKERGITLITVTSFDLTEARFPAIVRRLFAAADRATMDYPNLAWQVHQARMRFERGDNHATLLRLYREAEALSRMKSRPAKRRVSWWRRLCAMASG